MYQVIPAISLPWERVKGYIPDLIESFKKIVDRFPEDTTMESLIKRITQGANQLWFILNKQDNEFIAFVLLELDIAENGKKRITLLDLAGKGGIKLVEYLYILEDYARSIGAEDFTILGRKGWERGLKQKGYDIVFVKYRKHL
ncbi:MAG: hypothetical protein JSC085_000996 [Candidatus Tokpelaia sp. JSC085]|nr:MAG: hypothetical protein JSC085_000996 [Candidatus Tokpelaia sp. JSC085]